jgi:hypothetical protein
MQARRVALLISLVLAIGFPCTAGTAFAYAAEPLPRVPGVGLVVPNVPGSKEAHNADAGAHGPVSEACVLGGSVNREEPSSCAPGQRSRPNWLIRVTAYSSRDH